MTYGTVLASVFPRSRAVSARQKVGDDLQLTVGVALKELVQHGVASGARIARGLGVLPVQPMQFVEKL